LGENEDNEIGPNETTQEEECRVRNLKYSREEVTKKNNHKWIKNNNRWKPLQQ
jgi:hypothetical protein